MAKTAESVLKSARQNNEPVFVLRAKDKNSIDAILEYFGKCEETNCDQLHIDGVWGIYCEFVDWQRANEIKTKLPD